MCVTLPPQGPLFALPSWVSRGLPPAQVASDPMGSLAPPPPVETSSSCTGKYLTTNVLHLGACPPHATCPSFNTTASVAGMCFFPLLSLLRLLSVLLILFAYKTSIFGAPVFHPLNITPLLPPPPRWDWQKTWGGLLCLYLLVGSGHRSP